jgi:hypothetical protein
MHQRSLRGFVGTSTLWRTDSYGVKEALRATTTLALFDEFSQRQKSPTRTIRWGKVFLFYAVLQHEAPSLWIISGRLTYFFLPPRLKFGCSYPGAQSASIGLDPP